MRLSGVCFKQSPLAIGVSAALALSLSISTAAAELKVDMDIGSQQAGETLMELGQKTGVQIIVSPDIGKSVNLKSISGAFTLSEALDYLLSETGLVYELAADDVVVVKESDKSESKGEEDVEEVEEIVVTGSSLRVRDPSAPIEILTREDLELRGIFSADELMRNLSANFSNLSEATSTDEALPNELRVMDNMPTSGLQGASAANLRGIGLNGTLVLINGQRMAKSPVLDGAFVDLGVIPFSEIERVEILYDGASAKYGSDAIGGVVNFILRKSRNMGAVTSVRYESGRHGDQVANISQIFNFGWESGSASVSLNVRDNKPVSYTSAGWTTKDLRPLGGDDWRDFRTGQPGSVNMGYDYQLRRRVYASLPSDHSGVGATPEDFSESNNIANDWRLRGDSTVDRRTKSVRVSFEQELGLWDGVFTSDVTVSRNETFSEGNFPQVSVNLPSSNAYNPFNGSRRITYAFLSETESGLVEREAHRNINDSYNVNTLLEFDLPFNDWRMTLAGNMSAHKVESHHRALDQTRCGRDQDGQPIESCDVEDETLWYQALNSSNPDVALNLVGNGTAQTPWLSDMVTEYSTGAPKNRTYGYEALFEGEAFELPGGPVRMAFGYSRDVQVTDYRGDVLRMNGIADEGKVYAITDGAYGEASIPIIGRDNALPGVKMLRLGLQTRWNRLDTPQATTVDTQSSAVTPKYTIAWSPIDNLTIRGTWSESFRAPSPYENVGSRKFYDDPGTCTGDDCDFPWDHGWGANMWITWYPDMDGRIVNGEQVPGPIWDAVYVYQLGSNPGLKPERGLNKTVGFDWHPEFIDGLSVSATFNDVNYKDKIEQLTHAFYDPEEWQSAPNLYWEDPDTDRLMLVRDQPSNLALYRSKSVDFRTSYLFDTDWGSFNIGLDGTYTKSLLTSLFSTATPKNKVATKAGPARLKGRAYIGWNNDVTSLMASFNYGSGYTHTYYHSSYGESKRPTDEVDSYWTLDLTGSYQVRSLDLQLLYGIRDVTNADYPFINGTDGRPFDSGRVNVRGRTMYLQATKRFNF